MSDQPGREARGTARDSGASSSGTTTTDVVKDEAERVGGTAAESGRQVAGVAKEEAAHVADEARHQIRDLTDQARQELVDQAHQQKDRTANNLHALSDELRTMADSSDRSGTGAQLVSEAARRTGDAAQWLEHRQPGDLIDEVKSFARRRPGAFLLLAAGGGVLAGRLTRGTAQEQKATQGGSGGGTGQATQPSEAGTPATGQRPFGTAERPGRVTHDRPVTPTPGRPADPLLAEPTPPTTDQPVRPAPGPRDIRAQRTSAPTGRTQAVDHDV